MMSEGFFAYHDDRANCDREPQPGAVVRFDPDKLQAKRPDRPLLGSEGLVVHHDALDVLLWPDSLWRVGRLEGVTEAGPRWSRCKAFTVEEQVPTWLVSGPRGYVVEWVVARCRALTAEQVEALDAIPGDEEVQLTRDLWVAWGVDHRSGSPVGQGLGRVLDGVSHAARQTDDELFGWDDEDGVEVLTDRRWTSASHAAFSAALGLGAPDYLAPEQNAALARRWTAVFGQPPLPDEGTSRISSQS